MIIRENGLTYSDHLDDETLVPGGQLRTISQSQWVEKTLKHDKIGLIVNNELQLALMHWSKYKEMFESMKRLKERNEELEELLEDTMAAIAYSDRAEKYESGEANLIKASSPEEMVKKLKDDVYKRSETSEKD
ncbi:hypothetical protein [Oceanobacillus halotolerans]|uniref:hypothetical protein n=1 Tax=Oceanobacillus halotolerans TaxID=2663380 RepID=UPI0013DC3E9D|nr:hypothetical protein [Oceanobacillus halotolerans]